MMHPRHVSEIFPAIRFVVASAGFGRKKARLLGQMIRQFARMQQLANDIFRRVAVEILLEIINAAVHLPDLAAPAAHQNVLVEQPHGKILHQINRVGLLLGIVGIQLAPVHHAGPAFETGHQSPAIIGPVFFRDAQRLQLADDRVYRHDGKVVDTVAPIAHAVKIKRAVMLHEIAP